MVGDVSINCKERCKMLLQGDLFFSVGLEGLVSLLFLFDTGHVILSTHLQSLFILEEEKNYTE